MAGEVKSRMTIKSCKVPIVPRYNETDQGNVIHHSVYPVYFEIGRTELLKQNGTSYRQSEASGVFYVVAELNVKYRKPALYDDNLELETICSNVTPVKLEHVYNLRRDGVLLVEGKTVLVCIDKTGRIQRIPEEMFCL